MRWERGHLVLGRVRGVRVRVHLTAPLGALIFSGFQVAPAAWTAFGVVVLVGHAVLARLRGHRASAVTIHGAGGTCEVAGPLGPLDAAIVAWGGVLGQLALCALAVALGPMVGTGFAGDLVTALAFPNLLLALFNLLPFPPFDGRDAWSLFPELVRRALRTARPPQRRSRPPAPRAPIPFTQPDRREVRELGAAARRRAAETELQDYAEQMLKRRKPVTDKSLLN